MYHFKIRRTMKKVMLFSLVTLALASCTKYYTCECTNTSAYNGEADDPYTTNVVLEDVSKRTVSNSLDCVSYEGTSTDSDGDVYTYKTDCTVTKN
jgi:hypothetical protein